MSSAAGVPDLLRRFVPTPHSAVMTFDGDICATVQTNDLPLLTAIQHTATTRDSVAPNLTVRMTIIRDADAPSGGATLTLMSKWPLTTLFVGRGTLLTLDRDTHELFCFLAPSITAAELVNCLLPMLFEALRSGSGQQTLVHLADER